MGQITVPDLPDEDELYERSVQRQLDDEAEQRAREKLTPHYAGPERRFPGELTLARFAFRGALLLLALVLLEYAGMR